jgi:tetratricopeptide (TPR) repeat protein
MNKVQLKTRRDLIRTTYRDAEQPATVIALCEDYLKRDPLDGVVWAWYGHTLIEMARYTEADAALKTARGLVAADEHKAFTLECRGDLEAVQGRVEEAEGLYREAMALAPRSQWTFVQLGRLLFKQGRSTEAEDLLRHAVTLDGNRSGMALYELGHILRARGAFFEARRIFRQALTLIPDSEHTKDALADVEKAIGNVPTSVEFG